jgi:hypothetical protein
VLKIFKGEGGDHPEALGAATTPSRHSSSCLDTPSVQRTIRRIVNEAVAERNTETKKVIRKLGGVCLTLSAKLKLAEDREKGYIEALNSEKKKRKRGQPSTEELRAEEGIGVLVQKARELQDVKKAAREREALDKVSRAQARAASKVEKELEAQQKREDRAMRAEARKTEEALRKARREQAKAARNAQKQLETGSKTSQKRPRGRPPKQKKAQEPYATMIEPVEEMVTVQPKLRNGRIIRKPIHFDEI